MSKLKSMFRTSSATPATTAGEAARGDDLIAGFIEDHRALQAMLDALPAIVDARDFAAIPAMLQTFKTRLEAHALSENLRFYAPLEQRLRDDPVNAEIMHACRKNMGAISRVALDFCAKWRQGGVSLERKYEFLRELEQVREGLKLRVECEEKSLYPLYRA